jgi:hypothetical protein
MSGVLSSRALKKAMLNRDQDQEALLTAVERDQEMRRRLHKRIGDQEPLLTS